MTILAHIMLTCAVGLLLAVFTYLILTYHKA